MEDRMKPSKWTVLIALAFLAGTYWACGGGGKGEEAQPSSTSGAGSAPMAGPIDEATAGNIEGKVTLEGTPPEMHAIQMSADPYCAKAHKNPVETEFVVTGDDGGLANVFVYVKKGLDGRTFPVPSEPVVLQQTGCTYVPHVMGIQVGQKLEIVNDDDTLHNIHAMPKLNKEFNIGQPVKGLKTDHEFTKPEVMVPFKCDVHKWMNSYAGVVDNPFYAVTGKDGTYSIKGLPPGDYVIEAWQERFGTKDMNVKVAEKETAEADFTFDATAAP
jgi:plastocyanin